MEAKPDEEEISMFTIMSDYQPFRRAISDVTSEINKLAIIKFKKTIQQAECECCGIKEECTGEYISRIQDSFSGKWVCGLCSEVVKEKLNASDGRVDVEEAVSNHTNFLKAYNATRLNPKLSLTWTMRGIARRSSEFRTKNLGTPRIARSTSCVAKIDLVSKQ